MAELFICIFKMYNVDLLLRNFKKRNVINEYKVLNTENIMLSLIYFTKDKVLNCRMIELL